MNEFEIWSTVLAGLALIISGFSLLHSVRTQRRQDRGERKLRGLQEQIAALHLDELKEVHEQRHKSKLELDYYPRGNSQVIVIRNVGGVAARVTGIVATSRGTGNSPLNPSEVNEKLPATLHPRDECPLLAGSSSHSYPPFDVVVTWKDENGEEQSLERTIHG